VSLSSRRRGARSLKRVAGKKPELRTILVFTEGRNSEPDYINGLKGLLCITENVALNLELHPEHGVPLTLVQLAVDYKKDPEVDECWCLFDVEWPHHHPKLKDAVSLAQAHGIGLAISNPCFEVWLILHHQEFARFSDTSEAERSSRALDGRAGKSIDASLYMPLRRVAATRAKILEAHHERNGTQFPHDNPSSGMHLFLRSLEGDSGS
jgi:RloB-like protein